MEWEPVDSAGVMDGLRSLWKQEVFLDFTIEVEDEEFKVHKLVMASVSDYFKAMLTGGMMESRTDRVRLEGLNAHTVSKIIDFIYEGREFSDVEDCLEDLTECAVYLQIPGAIKECITSAHFFIDDWTESFAIMSMFQKYSVVAGVKMIKKLMISHFEDVVEAWTPEEMTHIDVKNLIDIWQNSEWDLYLTIKEWVDINPESRQQHFSSLMCLLRFALMTPEQLDIIKGSDLYSKSNSSWYEMVHKAVEYHNLPTYSKVCDDSNQSMVRIEPTLIYFDSDGTDLYQLSDEKPLGISWKIQEALDKPVMGNGIEMCVVANNFLIVCEMINIDQKWHIFDPRMMKWSPMAGLSTPRRYSALVYCNTQLYVLGGCPQWSWDPTDIIESYDFQQNSWSAISSKLPVAMFRHGAAVIDDCIYVAGGREYGEARSLRLDCFDTTSKTWCCKQARMEDEDFKGIGASRLDIRGLKVMELYNEKVLFVMCAGLILLYYSPARDEWVKWKCAEEQNVSCGNKFKWHYGAFVVGKNNKLLLLNFMRDNIYRGEDDPGTHGVCAEWTICPKMKNISVCELQQFPVSHTGLEQYNGTCKFLALPHL